MLQPQISYSPPAALVALLPSAFPPLSKEERRQEWARELFIAEHFAREADWYRAITSYKRAGFLLPNAFEQRRQEIEYGVLQSYYFGQKYADVLETYEHSTLSSLETFLPVDDLYIILSDAAMQAKQDKMASYWALELEKSQPELAERLALGVAIRTADLPMLSSHANEHSDSSTRMLLDAYQAGAKSVAKARVLNALLPGAGYLYVGQKSTAFTSFALNALFVAAAYHFFHHHNIAAAVITLSLESGWYVGGINGAGLAAKAYNENLYETLARETLFQERLFPVLLLKYAF